MIFFVTFFVSCANNIPVTYSRALGCDLLVHYGHSCLVPVDRTSGIKMLYVFVDIKLDSAHFVETVAFNFKRGKQSEQ